MKKLTMRVFAFMAVILVFAGAVLSTSYVIPSLHVNGAAEYETDELKDYAYQVAAIVNRERAANGLPILKYSDKLSEAANIRAKEIQTYFSHTRPDGRSCFTAVTDSGIRYRYIGENIAYGQRTPEEVMNAWMNSSGHRANILNNNVEYIGIGVAKRNGICYWTQFFALADGLSGDVITFSEQPQSTTNVTAAVSTTSQSTTTATVSVTAAVTQPCTSVSKRIEWLREILRRYGIELDDVLKQYR